MCIHIKSDVFRKGYKLRCLLGQSLTLSTCRINLLADHRSTRSWPISYVEPLQLVHVFVWSHPRSSSAFQKDLITINWTFNHTYVLLSMPLLPSFSHRHGTHAASSAKTSITVIMISRLVLNVHTEVNERPRGIITRTPLKYASRDSIPDPED